MVVALCEEGKLPLSHGSRAFNPSYSTPACAALPNCLTLWLTSPSRGCCSHIVRVVVSRFHALPTQTGR